MLAWPLLLFPHSCNSSKGSKIFSQCTRADVPKPKISGLEAAAGNGDSTAVLLVDKARWHTQGQVMFLHTLRSPMSHAVLSGVGLSH